MDDDGRDDLIIVTADYGELEGDVSVVFSGSDGAPAKMRRWERVRSRVTVGDADGDGFGDILLTTSQWLDDLPDSVGENSPSAGLSILRNTGERDFVPIITPDPDRWGAAEDPREAFFGPFTDANTELIAGEGLVDFHSGEDLFSLPALATASTAYAWRFGRFNSQQEEVKVIALTGAATVVDGQYEPELALWIWDYGKAGPDPVIPLTMPTAGKLTAWVELFDVDGDGNQDALAQTSGGAIHVAWGQSDGSLHSDPDEPGSDWTFGPPIVEHASGGRVLTVHDLNGDEAPDFVMQRSVAVSGPCDGEDDGYSCCAENYRCTIRAFDETVDPWRSAVVADLDNDGDLDAIGVSETRSNRVEVLRGGTGHKAWGLDQESIHVGDGAAALAVKDVDADGIEDVLVRLEGEAPDGTRNDEIKAIWGDPTTRSATPLAAGIGLHSIMSLHGDYGRLDDDSDAQEQIFLAVAGERTDAAEEYGFATVVPVAHRVIASSFDPPQELTDEAGVWTEYQNVALGSFSGTGNTELAVAGALFELPLLGTPNALRERVQTLGLLPSRPGFVEVEERTSWNYYAPEFDDVGLPDLTSLASTELAADLDGDGRDELLLVGSLSPKADTIEVLPRGGWFVAVYGQDGDRWSLLGGLQDIDSGLNFGGEWPYVRAPQLVEFADLDADGDLDLFAVGADELGVSQAAVVLLNEGGELTEHSTQLSRDDDVWRAVSLLDGTKTDAQRLALVTDSGLKIGSFDVEDMTFDERSSYSVPSGQAITTTGDFNGDGLQDLALGTDNGVQLFFGIATHGD
jgi:hypothetical protein